MVMGRLIGSFGIQGWLKVNFFTESAASLAQYERWIVRTRDGWTEMAVEDFAVHSKGPVAKLAGCGDRDAADRLRGCDVAVTARCDGRGAARNALLGRPGRPGGGG